LTLQVKDLLAEPPLDADAVPEAGLGAGAGADNGEGMDVDGDADGAAERKTAREAVRRAREGVELFCEVGKWLTEMAAREVCRPVHGHRRALARLTPKPPPLFPVPTCRRATFADAQLYSPCHPPRQVWLRERDAGEEEEADAAQDVTSLTLAPGPLLLPAVRDPEHARFNCWQLANDSSWPEVARMLLARQGAAPELEAALKAVEPARLPAEQKAALLAFLCNEAAACDKVHLAIPPPRWLVLLCTPHR
jgi:hypothetical protein